MTEPVQILLAAGLGLAAGWLHFHSLHRLAPLILTGNRRAIGLQLLRLAGLAGFLVLAARAGALPLLAGAGGILAGRALVMRMLRRAG